MNFLPSNRRNEILDILIGKEHVEYSYLSEKFNVSEMTIRRDIDKLSKSGLVVKVYGGARLKKNKPTEYDKPVKLRKIVNQKSKKIIAKEAIKLINDGDVIAFDASTTALEVSYQLKYKKIVTVVTNNINIAIELAEDPDITIILLGGFMRKKSLSLTGSLIAKSLNSIYIDKAFISARSIDLAHGLTDILIDEGEAKQALIHNSIEVYALLDHTKINTRSFFKVCSIGEIDTLITDALHPFNEETLNSLNLIESNNIKVIIAHMNDNIDGIE